MTDWLAEALAFRASTESPPKLTKGAPNSSSVSFGSDSASTSLDSDLPGGMDDDARPHHAKSPPKQTKGSDDNRSDLCETTAKTDKSRDDDAFVSFVGEFARDAKALAQLIAEAKVAGLELTVEGDGLRVRHRTNANPDPALIERLAANKPAVIAELRRRADLMAYATEKLSLVDESRPASAPIAKGPPELSRRGVMCATCLHVDRCFTDPAGRYACPACAEWRVAGCAHFTVLRTCDEAAEAARGACLACGASIELHGRPPVATWRRVESVDDVALVEVRFVLALAAAAARGRQ